MSTFLRFTWATVRQLSSLSIWFPYCQPSSFVLGSSLSTFFRSNWVCWMSSILPFLSVRPLVNLAPFPLWLLVANLRPLFAGAVVWRPSSVVLWGSPLSTFVIFPLELLVVDRPPFQLGLLVVDLLVVSLRLCVGYLPQFPVAAHVCQAAFVSRRGPSWSTILDFSWGCWLSSFVRLSWGCGLSSFAGFPLGLLVVDLPRLSAMAPVVNLPPFQLGLLVVDLRPFPVCSHRFHHSSFVRWGWWLSTFLRFDWARWLSTFLRFPLGLVVADLPVVSAGGARCQTCVVSNGAAGCRPPSNFPS